MKYLPKCISIIILYFLIQNSIYAYNLKQVLEKGRLSNSSITSLCQDDKGVMWIGTFDGLNTYNGREITNYNPSDNDGYLSGNFINNIIYTGDNTYWIQNYHGLNMYNTKKNKLIIYDRFNKLFLFDKDKDNTIFVVQENNCIFYYHKETKTFKRISLPGLILSNILRFFIDKQNRIWMITKNDNWYCYDIINDPITAEKKLVLKKSSLLNYDLSICFEDGNSVYLVDSNNNMYDRDLYGGTDKLIYNFNNEIKSRGHVLTIIKDKNKFFIGFSRGGLVLLEKKDFSNDYKLIDLGINCGVLCIKKDRFQDIVWIGTDGQGIYLYSETSYSIKSTVLNNETYKFGHPVRSIFLDKQHTLWVGSKGDGILKFFNYDATDNISNCKVEKINTKNSTLSSDEIYCFAESKKNLLWIGNEDGLNYYSYRDKKIKRISINANGKIYNSIHDVYEDHNSNLWITTVGMGVIKAHLEGSDDNPVINDVKCYSINNNDYKTNFFFSILYVNDSVILFGNKGNGPYRFNNKSKTLEPLNVFKNYKPKTIYDVVAISKDKANNYYFATGFGMVQNKPSGKIEIYNTKDGFLSNSVHNILQGRNSNVWVSTNQGIVLFDSEKNSIRIFESEYNHDVVEFCNGAAYKDKASGILFFGGINGFVSIIERNIDKDKYMPSISFEKLTLFGEKNNIFKFLSEKSKNNILSLKYNQNFFSISFTAVDYVHGNNYNYYYKLNGLRDQWINNGLSNVAAFTNISPGDYVFQVKYYNRTEGRESPVYSMNIHVEYPWYRTWWAYFLYFILLSVVTLLIIRFIFLQIKHNEYERLNEMEKKHQKEVFESKLDFFTNITHEFCAPLTLISGPCERILVKNGVDKFVVNYVKMIKTNADRLNNLIQELIEFRKIETKNRNLQIESFRIFDLIDNTLNTFNVIAESRKIDFKYNVPDSISWNTDKGFFISIIINLLSNAFKYTPVGRRIKLDLSVVKGKLVLKIANEGSLDNINFVDIFDRYTILENFEKQESNQPFSRTGLGLAISSNMIKLLDGTVNVENTIDNLVLFTVSLPEIIIPANKTDWKAQQIYIPTVEVPLKITLHEEDIDKLKLTILIIDDDVEMLWFISEIFSDKFNAIRLQDSSSIDQVLKEFHPDLIISDVIMSGLNGIDLLKKIKDKKDTYHIPVILVSAKHEIDQQLEALSLGAEMYITKPFNTEFLKISVNQIFERKEKFKDYFSSPISSFNLNEGRLTHNQHKQFLQSVLVVINDNIKDPNLSTKFIADKLGLGIRSLSRKLEEIGESSPSTLIRDCRLFVAKNLIIQTTLTIDEIAYKSGFSDRTTFFKVFNKKFNCTPKEYRINNSGEVIK